MQRCYEFRLEVEPANAFYAAKRHNDIALAAIGSVLELMRDTTRARGHREDAGLLSTSPSPSRRTPTSSGPRCRR
ncbi:MAG: hypothetical protein QHC89_00995 [Bosea sp. (in: a-proteobacteria)]|nr:hypothetical protein [Bosea sp. (in: a-proteobacteria)]